MTSRPQALAVRQALSLGSWSVTEPARKPLVLIVDEDLGYVWWLGELFSEAGCQVVPALSPYETDSITQELDRPVDVIVVNPELAGVSEMIQNLSRSQAPKVVVIRDQDQRDSGLFAHATLNRPSSASQLSQQNWLGSVKRLVKELQAMRLPCPEFS
jgi:hypothetical protein